MAKSVVKKVQCVDLTVRNPCVRGGSQKAYTKIGFDSPYLRMLMFVLKNFGELYSRPNPKN
jgi:hypothetical protein